MSEEILYRVSSYTTGAYNFWEFFSTATHKYVHTYLLVRIYTCEDMQPSGGRYSAVQGKLGIHTCIYLTYISDGLI